MRHFILAAVVGLILCDCPAQAETLQKKFGPGWNCSYISVELKNLYDACMRCDPHKEHFVRDGYDHGFCIDKNSLRENLTTRPDYESPQEQQMRLNGAAAVARELQELQRRRNQRTPPESDVSGTGGGRLAPAKANLPPGSAGHSPTRESGVSGSREPTGSRSDLPGAPVIGAKPSNVGGPTHSSAAAPVGGVHIGAAPVGKESDLSELRRRILGSKKPDS